MNDGTEPEGRDNNRIEQIIHSIADVAGKAYENWFLFRVQLHSKRRQLREYWGQHWFDVHHLGLLLGTLAFGIIIGGALVQYGGDLSVKQMVIDLWANAGTELMSIVITVLVIDAFIRRRDSRNEVQRKKGQLYMEARSENPEVARRALEEMRQHGWLGLHDHILAGANLSGVNFSGTNLSWANLEKTWLNEANLKGADLRWARLNGANLQRVNLQGANLLDSQFIVANLIEADLREANLDMANLLGADIRHANLARARMYKADLQGARLVEANLAGATVSDCQFLYACALKEVTMPDGNRYDGRFNLEGDLTFAQINGLDLDNPEDMASWYLVSINQYLEGQAWFKQNSDKLQQDWKQIVESHHGPKKDTKGLCGPTPAEKEIFERVRKHGMRPQAEVKPIVVDEDEPPPPPIQRPYF